MSVIPEFKDQSKDVWISTHFRREDFACKCGCGFDDIDMELVGMLDAMVDCLGYGFTIDSGCRCNAHNIAVGGTKNSSHVLRLAVDIHVPDNGKRLEMIKAAILAGFNRIGIGGTFLHLDKDKNKPSNRMWLY